MNWFIDKSVDWNSFKLLIDKNIFNKDIVLKSAYNFLDKWYFFFKLDSESNIVLNFSKKEWIDVNIDEIISSFSDELLSVYLRDKLEKDNKVIRETIINSAIWFSLDTKNYIKLDISKENKDEKIDFDKDIDDILKEIEKDPDIKIDWNEIEKILKEIEMDLVTDKNTKNPL